MVPLFFSAMHALFEILKNVKECEVPFILLELPVCPYAVLLSNLLERPLLALACVHRVFVFLSLIQKKCWLVHHDAKCRKSLTIALLSLGLLFIDITDSSLALAIVYGFASYFII